MVLISVQSVETNNGYQFKNDFAEALIIDPNAKISLINLQFTRKVDYVVLATGNAFKVKVGNPANAEDVIGIPAGNYTATALASEIQKALNDVYYQTGHTFSVSFDAKAGKFKVSATFQELELKLFEEMDWDNTNTDYVEGATAVANINGVVAFGPTTAGKEGATVGITNGTANYVMGKSLLETELVPSYKSGGSFVQFAVNRGVGGSFPPQAGAGSTFGFIIGLTEGFDTPTPATGVKQISANANLATWLECGIVFFNDENNVAKVKFIEQGVDIGAEIKFGILTSDRYRITFAPDTNYPIYQYKRNNANWVSFPIGGGIQTLSQKYWRNMNLVGCVASDCLSTGQFPSVAMDITTAGSSTLMPVAWVSDASSLNHTVQEDDANSHTNKFSRTVAGNSADGYNTVKEGVLSQVITANDFADLTFRFGANEGDMYVSVIDEEQRVKNKVAQGNADGDMGIGNVIVHRVSFVQYR